MNMRLATKSLALPCVAATLAGVSIGIMLMLRESPSAVTTPGLKPNTPAALAKQDGPALPGALDMATDKQFYLKGQDVKVTVRSPKEGHLRVYMVSSDGRTSQIFPNHHDSDDRIPAGRGFTFPRAHYGIVLWLPDGTLTDSKVIHAVFSEKPFTDDNLVGRSGHFPLMGRLTRDERLRRGIDFDAGETVRTAETTIQISVK
jgi:hypothetical protein